MEALIADCERKDKADKERETKEKEENEEMIGEIMRVKQEKMEIQEELDVARASSSPALAQNVPRGSVETVVS